MSKTAGFCTRKFTMNLRILEVSYFGSLSTSGITRCGLHSLVLQSCDFEVMVVWIPWWTSESHCFWLLSYRFPDEHWRIIASDFSRIDTNLPSLLFKMLKREVASASHISWKPWDFRLSPAWILTGRKTAFLSFSSDYQVINESSGELSKMMLHVFFLSLHWWASQLYLLYCTLFYSPCWIPCHAILVFSELLPCITGRKKNDFEIIELRSWTKWTKLQMKIELVK